MNLTYSPDGVRGTLIKTDFVDGARDTIHLDRPTPSMILDRRHLLTFVPWLPLEPGRTFPMWIHDDFVGRIVSLRVAVGDRVHMIVPAGAFEAYRVDVTLEEPRYLCSADILFPTVLYVTADSPRRIVRIERPRVEWIAELTHEATGGTH